MKGAGACRKGTGLDRKERGLPPDRAEVPAGAGRAEARAGAAGAVEEAGVAGEAVVAVEAAARTTDKAKAKTTDKATRARTNRWFRLTEKKALEEDVPTGIKNERTWLSTCIWYCFLAAIGSFAGNRPRPVQNLHL